MRYDLRGVPILQQGDKVDGFYIILDGFLEIVRHRADGQRRVLAYLREGEYLGEIGLLGSGASWASAFTAGKCELIKIDKDGFAELCRDYPETERALRESRRIPQSDRSRCRPRSNAATRACRRTEKNE